MSNNTTTGDSASKSAIKNTFWAYIAFTFGKVLAFVTTIILARLLLPEQFGIVGYCTLALQYLDLLNDFGVGHALISRRDRIQEAANAAFVIGLGISLLLFLAAWFAAPFIALFFREPMVTELFRALSTVLIIGGIGIVPNAMLQRELRFKERMIPDVGSTILKGVVSITLAWTGFGVWSLIWGQIAAQAFASLVPWILVRWHPTIQFSRQVFREMFSFGSQLTFVGLIGSFMINVDYLLIGRILGAASLGFYTVAYRIPELIIRNTTYIIGKVAYPVLAKLQTDDDKMRSMYFAYLRYLSLFSLPCGVGLALIAKPFVYTFYPIPIWEPAIVPIRFIALAIGLSFVSHIPGIIYKAINRPIILTRLAMVKLPLVVATLWVGTRWGINGVAAGQLVLTLICMVLDSVVASRVIRFSLVELLKTLAPAVCSTAIMGLVAGALLMILPSSNVATLMIIIVTSAVTYIGTLSLISRDTIVWASTALRAAFARS